jgi:hypothetical protein
MQILKLLCICLLVECVYAKTNLYVNYYTETNRNVERQIEIDTCLHMNINNKFIDDVYVIVNDSQRYAYLEANPKVHLIMNPNQPTFQDVFESMTIHSKIDDVSITCNSDIYFDETIDIAIKYIKSHKNVAFALSRWDVDRNGKLSQITNPGSQDSWIIYSKPKHGMDSNFKYGKWACDNRIAYELHKVGYRVLNPAHTIIAHHLHSSDVRTVSYAQNPPPHAIIPPPYKTIPLIHLK